MEHLHVVQVFSQESIEELARVSHNSHGITLNRNYIKKKKKEEEEAKYGQFIYSKPVKLKIFTTNQLINVI